MIPFQGFLYGLFEKTVVVTIITKTEVRLRENNIQLLPLKVIGVRAQTRPRPEPNQLHVTLYKQINEVCSPASNSASQYIMLMITFKHA